MSNNSHAIFLVMASDDRWAMPLTVAAYSAIAHLTDCHAHLFILEDGIRPTSKRKITRSLPADRVTIHWIQPASPRLEEVFRKTRSGRYPLANYYRLLLPQILPQDIKKVIYLDPDVIVLRDLVELWSINTANYHFLAVQEPDDPYVIDCFYKNNPQLRHRIDFAKFGVTREHKYGNGGVLVFNLEKWRQDGITEKAFRFLESYSPRWPNQDSLNVILAGQWGTLDPRWNQTGAFYLKHKNNPYTAEVIDQVLRDPFIVHFTGKAKPWDFESPNPRAGLFSEYCSQTAWAWSFRWQSLLHRSNRIARSLKRSLVLFLKRNLARA